MNNIDDVDRLFKILEEMMSRDFSGGYKTTSYSNSNRDVDIQEDGKYIYITMELKVQKEDLDIEIKEDMIVLQVMINGTWITKYINLSNKVNPKTAKTIFNNGILDIELEKIIEEKTDVDEKI